MGENNTHWRGNWQYQRPTRKATYRLEVSDVTEGAEWGHRCQERHSRRWKQQKRRKKTEKESEREETEKKTNDHMKRKSHKERDRLCHTESNSTMHQPFISQSITFVNFYREKKKAANCNSSIVPPVSLRLPLFHVLIFLYWFSVLIFMISYCLARSFLGWAFDSRTETKSLAKHGFHSWFNSWSGWFRLLMFEKNSKKDPSSINKMTCKLVLRQLAN